MHGNFFLCPLVRICQGRSNHESGLLVDNPVSVGEMACQCIMQLVTQYDLKGRQQRMKCLCYLHVGKIEHDCLVFVAVGRLVIFGNSRIRI